MSQSRTLSTVVLVSAGLAASALVLAGCTGGAGAASGSTAAASGAPTQTVRVAVTTGTTTLDLADAEGFFAEHGIDLEVTSLATGTETIAAVQGGSADIAYADTFAGANAISNGFDIAVVAGANYTSPAVSYLVKADSPIRTAADLSGASLGLGGVPFFRVFANEFLEHADVDPAAVDFTLVKQGSTLPEALESGSVDAIQSLGFQVAYANDGTIGYDFRVVGDTDTSEYQNPDAAQAAFWTTAKWGAANADTTQEFANAYREFAAWYNDLGAEDRATHALELNKIDYVALAGGDQEKLENLAFRSAAKLIDTPVDAKATQEWLTTGNTVAPDQVPAGVDIVDALLPSAK